MFFYERDRKATGRKSVFANAGIGMSECWNLKTQALKSENVYVFFQQKDALNFDSFQFFAYFCNQKRKLIFKDTNRNYSAPL